MYMYICDLYFSALYYTSSPIVLGSIGNGGSVALPARVRGIIRWAWCASVYWVRVCIRTLSLRVRCVTDVLNSVGWVSVFCRLNTVYKIIF